MYPDEINNYMTSDQFIKHRRLLKDLKKHYIELHEKGEMSREQLRESLAKLREEKTKLERCFARWKKNQAK